MTDDLDLLLAWRGGDEQAGNALARRHFQGIYSFFRTKAPDVAEDLVQQTFLHAVRARDRVDARGGFRAYLFGIARHRLLHHYDAVRAARHAASDEPVVDPRSSPSKAARRDERSARILAALELLPIDERLAIELTYWHELSGSEVAQVLEIPLGTVKSRIRRARVELRSALESLGLSPDDAQTTVLLVEQGPLADEP
ncbi:MAG TPA: sigma-70 family RNA polymerase sigma factor [Nannocystaceae bacterium]|nr:sigma-70 family RNA polymerase sigma factor [Nannocystaceae bacterium]